MVGNTRLQRLVQRKFVARVVLAVGLALAVGASYTVHRALEENAQQRLATAARSAATYVSAFLEALQLLLATQGSLTDADRLRDQLTERLGPPLDNTLLEGESEVVELSEHVPSRTVRLVLRLPDGWSQTYSMARLLDEAGAGAPRISLELGRRRAPEPGVAGVALAGGFDPWGVTAHFRGSSLVGWPRYLPFASGALIALAALLAYEVLKRLQNRYEFAVAFSQTVSEIAESNQRRLLDFIELSADWLWEVDGQHRFTLVSNGIRSTANMDPSSFIGMRPWELDFEDLSEGFWDDYRTCIARREELRVVTSRRDSDGRLRHLEFIGRPMLERNGHFTGYRGVGRDLTGRIEAARERRASEERFRDLVALSSDWYWEQDDNLRFSDIATAGGSLAPWIRERWLGHTLQQIAEERGSGGHWPELATAQQAAKAHQYERAKLNSRSHLSSSGERPHDGPACKCKPGFSGIMRPLCRRVTKPSIAIVCFVPCRLSGYRTRSRRCPPATC